MVVEIVCVATFALSRGNRQRCIGSATNEHGIIVEVVTVGAGGCCARGDSAMGLACRSKWSNGSGVAALAVIRCCRGILADQHGGGMIVLVVCETGIRAVTALTVACTDGGDVSFGCEIGQGGVDIGIDVASSAGRFVDIDWLVGSMT